MYEFKHRYRNVSNVANTTLKVPFQKVSAIVEVKKLITPHKVRTTYSTKTKANKKKKGRKIKRNGLKI